MIPPEKLLAQRNQAIACAVLSLVISLALVTDNFLQHRRNLITAQQQILELQKVLTDTQHVLRQNEQALLDTQKALARARTPGR